ncbi:hypothetical protein [Gluconobacter oxydans]|uniref:Uncharacterized protein n=2 Tax=Gluconobacter oxydans TaxID=442 RepID=Q5FPJ4_GLUOX|nr:hypothetical protein [Gluconobacter oxydans]AAW61702.1 Hypothetical protein GOX1966 [Gluconobacter oxydans 621H]KXV11873.1 hypothetical protein AD932_10110 [Gluconobacter oxydans]KXV17729.1 hypothetical protein AD934_10710 [Gluconobacter oxydans]KXV30440.1 hypothetical protein AD939_11715 [Gluconobacter oxydans]MBF0856197.1 hypothetical protein [Gluconobacter oxydans]
MRRCVVAIRKAALFGLVVAGIAGSGSASAAEAAWTASKCGAEPQAPVVKAATVAQYNESVDRVTAYEKAARVYNACVAAQANREETAISQEASARISHVHAGSAAVQSHIAASFQTLSANLAAASRKLGHH